MTLPEFLRLGIGVKVLAFTGGHEHVAMVLQKDRERCIMLLSFLLADGTWTTHWRGYHAVERCDQGASVGRTERRLSPVALAVFMQCDHAEVRL